MEDDRSADLVGVFQDVYIKEEDKQTGAVASGMLQGIEKSIDISVLQVKRLRYVEWRYI